MSRTRRDALHAHRQILQLSLSCITNAVLIAQRSPVRLNLRGRETDTLVLNHGAPAPLRGALPVALSLYQVVDVRLMDAASHRAWRVRMSAYAYTFRTPDGTEILSLQWHPEGAEFVPFPHLHVGSAMIAASAPIRSRDFHRAHIPTSLVLLEDIVHFAITEFRVAPLRDDWQSVLEQARERRDELTRVH
jgi:hypothetical protein